MTSATTSTVQTRSAPSKSEASAMSRARGRVRARRPAFAVRIELAADGRIGDVGSPHSDEPGWLARLSDAFASTGTDFAISQLNHIAAAATGSDGRVDGAKVNAMLAMIEAAAPENELQAALAVQIAVLHFGGLLLVRKAMAAETVDQLDCVGTMAMKFLRTLTSLTEALAKLQRRGEQVVKVVHVHPGAQAIVGNVSSAAPLGRTGGGGCHEIVDQPHAKGRIAADRAQPMLPLWGEDAQWELVPLAGCRG